MTEVDGMVVRGDKLVIPEELQPIVIHIVHEGTVSSQGVGGS